MSLGPLFWTPTIEGLLNYEYFRDNPEALDDPAWQAGLPAAVVADIKKSLEHPDRLPYFQLTRGAAADARAQVQAAPRGGRRPVDRDRQRHPDELPQPLDLARARRLGQRARRRSDDRDPRRDLLAVGGDEGGCEGRHGERRASTPTSSPSAATCCATSRCCSASTSSSSAACATSNQYRFDRPITERDRVVRLIPP